jgi:hypothetical protein
MGGVDVLSALIPPVALLTLFIVLARDGLSGDGRCPAEP